MTDTPAYTDLRKAAEAALAAKVIEYGRARDRMSALCTPTAILALLDALASERTAREKAEAACKRAAGNWHKIVDAVIEPGPMCRDCADFDGTCQGGEAPCDPTEHVIWKFKRIEAALAASQEEVKRLREALEPFAKAGEVKLCGEWRDDERFGHTDVTFYLTFGDLRRAREALKETP
jgi:hypothetical protein